MQKAGDFASPVGSFLLDDNLAITKLCMRASCSHVESYCIFNVSFVI